MNLHLTVHGRRDVVEQVYRQLRTAITDGRLKSGEPLPSIRELARHVGASRNTISAAYDRLAIEGLVRSRTGAGTFVSGPLSTSAELRRESPLRPRAEWNDIRSPRKAEDTAIEFDLRTGIPAIDHFPYATWRSLISHQLRAGTLQKGAAIALAGTAELRAAIAQYVHFHRAVRADADSVFVTAGSQHAIDLVARVLLEPGDLVALEDPGYPPAHQLFASLGAQVVGVPVDAEGLIVDAIPRNTRLVCVTPSHQFPLGVPLSAARRVALVEWAEQAEAAILENDHGCEFRYGGRPLDPLHALDRSGRVIYMGSLSRLLLPSLRLGFLIAPTSLHAALHKAAQVANWNVDIPTQNAAANFIKDGHLSRYLRRIRHVYTGRRHQVQAALADGLADHLETISTPTGLHFATLLRHQLDDSVLTAHARTHGIAIQPLSQYAVKTPARQGLLVGYGAIPTERLDQAMRRLALVLSETKPDTSAFPPLQRWPP